MENTDVTYKGAVYPWHCDQMGHMNVMWYVGKFDEATWALVGRIGLTPEFLRNGGRGMAAVEQRIQYKREAFAGDILEIRSKFLEVNPKSLRFAHEMRDLASGEITATTEIVGVHTDTNARKAVALPDEIRLKATEILRSQES